MKHKNMKTKYAILVLFLPLFISAHSAYAIGTSYFPSSSRMQPAPRGIHANISHNIEDAGIVAPTLVVEPPKQEASSTVPVNDASPSSQSHVLWWVIGILVFVSLFYFIKKRIEFTD
jgi:hypothetical protein